jgi:Mn-dependent DtxR family transcriptional regulator
MVQDRVQTEELELTHSFLALMLGIRRPTVTLVARSLQRDGLLEMRRGFFKIKDRPAMEAASCECYQQVKDLYDKLYKRHARVESLHGERRSPSKHVAPSDKRSKPTRYM